MKKALFAFLCVCSLLLVLGAAACADGAAEIRTRADLEAIADNTGGHYILVSDIDLSGEPWTPIPDFFGTLDGQGHRITGMTLRASGSAAVTLGLFETLHGASISNLRLSDVSIEAATSGGVYIAPLGRPANADAFDVGSDACCIYNCEISGSISADTDFSGGGVTVYALICAENSSADMDVSVNAQRVNAGLLWKCRDCSVVGDMRLTAAGGSAARMIDCADCTSRGDLIVERSSGTGDLTAAGIIGMNGISSGCAGEGRVECAGRASLLSNCDYCTYSGSLVSDNGLMVTHCYACEVNCQASNYGSGDQVYFRIIDDQSEDRGGNTAYGQLSRKGSVNGFFDIRSYLGRGSTDHVSIDMRDGKGTGGVCFVSGGVNGAADVYPHRTGSFHAETVSGFITFQACMVNKGDITCISDTGKVVVMGGVYNTGGISVSSGGEISVNGASYYNSGNIHVVSAGSTCDVKGVDCDLFGNRMSGAVNRGAVTLEASLDQTVHAIGVIHGIDACNLGAISVTGSKTSGKAAAMGVADSFNSYNYANISSLLGNGNAYAVGVDGSGCVNYGSVRAVGCTKDGIGACGYQTEDGQNYSSGDVYAENSYSDLRLGAWGAYAQAYNSSGNATAISQHVAVANGGSTFASSAAYGLGASNGQVGWYLAYHRADCDCGTAKTRVTDGSDPSDSNHTWVRRCDASLQTSGEVPAGPDAPEAEIPEEETGDPDGKVWIELFADKDCRQAINGFTYACGSISFAGGDANDKSLFYVRVSVENRGDTRKDWGLLLRLPDGFSTREWSYRPTELMTAILATGESRSFLIPVYPIYLDSCPQTVTFKITGSMQKHRDVAVTRNPDEGIVICRPTGNFSLNTRLPIHVDLDPARDLMQTATDRFSENLSLMHCALSQAVYEKDFIEKSVRNLGYTKYKFYNTDSMDHGTGVALAQKKLIVDGRIRNSLLVVVRGTYEYEWIGNFLVNYSNGRNSGFHDDFYDAANSTLANVIDYCDQYSVPEDVTRIQLGGHSRGGAVVDLICGQLYGASSFIDDFTAYTFAAPNSTKSPRPLKNVFNIVYYNDLVGFVPQGYGKTGVTMLIGCPDEEDVPESVKTLFFRYSDREYKHQTLSRWLIGLIVNFGETANTIVSHEIAAGTLGYTAVKNGQGDSDIARAHSGENYLAWMLGAGLTGETMVGAEQAHLETYRKAMERAEDAQHNTIDLLENCKALKKLPRGIAMAKLTAATLAIYTVIGYEINYYTNVIWYVDCPVNVELLNGSGASAASFDDHTVAEDGDMRCIAMSGEETDVIAFPRAEDYTLRITASDDGVMTVGGIDLDREQVAAFCEIPIRKGEVLTLHSNGSENCGDWTLVSSSGSVYQAASSHPGAVPITKDYFPDRFFRAYVSETWDHDENGILDKDEIASAEYIMLSIYAPWVDEGIVTQEEADYVTSRWQNRIASLEGLQYFTHLRWLAAFDMPRMSGALDFGNNTRLETVNVWNSGLTGITLGSLSKLSSIHCESNPIGSLDVSRCPALTDIHAMSCGLRVLDVSANTRLEALWCYENDLSALDVSGNPLLVELGCQDNHLRALSVNHLKNLQYLNAGGNALTALDVRGLHALDNLHCYSNALTRLDLSDCGALVDVDCGRNPLTALNLAGNPRLDRLRCYETALTALDLSGVPALSGITVYASPIRVLDISPCPTLAGLVSEANYGTQEDGAWYAAVSDGREAFVAFSVGTLLKVKASDAFTSLILPASLTEIGAEAFAGVAADIVELPQGCLSIASRAFADSPALKVIYVPEAAVIADDAFSGSSNVFVRCY